MRRLHLLRAWRQGDPPVGLATVLPRVANTVDGAAASHATPFRTQMLTLWRDARSFAATWLQAHLPGLQVRLSVVLGGCISRGRRRSDRPSGVCEHESDALQRSVGMRSG